VPGRSWLNGNSWTPSKAGWKKAAGAATPLYWHVVAQDSLGRTSTSAVSSLVVAP